MRYERKLESRRRRSNWSENLPYRCTSHGYIHGAELLSQLAVEEHLRAHVDTHPDETGGEGRYLPFGAPKQLTVREQTHPEFHLFSPAELASMVT